MLFLMFLLCGFQALLAEQAQLPDWQNPFLPTVHFVTIRDEDMNPGTVFAHIGDRIQFKWKNLTTVTYVAVLDKNGVILASEPPSTVGSWYWYPTDIGLYFVYDVSVLHRKYL